MTNEQIAEKLDRYANWNPKKAKIETEKYLSGMFTYNIYSKPYWTYIHYQDGWLSVEREAYSEQGERRERLAIKINIDEIGNIQIGPPLGSWDSVLSIWSDEAIRRQLAYIRID